MSITSYNLAPDPVLRVAIEIISAVACFILIRFMIKPYRVTGEGRYIGLPLGFGFLGASFAISAVTYAQLLSNSVMLWFFQLIIRAFAFIFLAIAYYFSNKPFNNRNLIFNFAFSGLIFLATSVILIFIAPQLRSDNYIILNFAVRLESLICILYIFIHCTREQMKEPDQNLRWILVGYALLGLNQFSSLFWIFYVSNLVFWLSLTFRLMSLSVFLFVMYKIFYKKKEKGSEN